MTDPASFPDLLAGPCSTALGRPPTNRELEHAANHLNLLLKWQKTQRLVASDDPGWVARHLVADSLLFLRVLPSGVRSVLDVGSGAGFPGVPIRIFGHDIAVTLVESRQRRASFLRAVIRELGIGGLDVIDQRLESLAPRLADTFDAATLRCAGEPQRFLSVALALVRPGGMVVASGPPIGVRSSRTRLPDAGAAEHGPSKLERVMVEGLEGRRRQFLVAQKS